MCPASPYTDDASFASFVAGEAHDSGSPMDDDHFSPSPSPLPSMAQVRRLPPVFHNKSVYLQFLINAHLHLAVLIMCCFLLVFVSSVLVLHGKLNFSAPPSLSLSLSVCVCVSEY